MTSPIEKNNVTSLKQVPFRLPSLLQKSLCLDKQIPKNPYSSQKGQMDLPRLPDQQSCKSANHSETEDNTQSLAGLLFNGGEEYFQKPFTNHSKRFILSKQKLFDTHNNGINNISKPLWVSEIKLWLEQNSSEIEFLKLATSATIYGSWISHNSICRPEEIRNCERFFRHFHLKDMGTVSEKIKHKYRKAKRRLMNVDLAKVIETILEEHEEYDKKMKNNICDPIEYKTDSIGKSVLSEGDSRETKVNFDQKSVSTLDDNTQLEDVQSIEGNGFMDAGIIYPKFSSRGLLRKNIDNKDNLEKVTNVSESSDCEYFEQLIKYKPVQQREDETNKSLMDKDDTQPSPVIVDHVDDKDHLAMASTGQKQDDLISTSLEEIPNVDNSSSPLKEMSEEISNSLKSDSQPILQETNSKKESPTPLRKRMEVPRRVVFDISIQEKLEKEVIQEIKIDSFIISSKESHSRESSTEALRKPVIQLPPLPNFSNSKPSQESTSENQDNKSQHERDKLAPLLKREKRKWGKKNTDLSYLKEMERERLAEERKLRAEKLNKKAKEKKTEPTLLIPDAPRFESYGFLAKYCILKKISVALYHSTFEQCDEEGKQWLSNAQLMIALKGVNPNLKDYDIAYLNMVMKTCDYNLRSGADFKLFAILAALSVQISTLDSWIRNEVGKSDFKLLEKKTYICRQLWEVNVDPSTNTIPLDRLCVELKAGGVKDKHIEEVRQRIGWMRELNLLDYFTYIPLFILMHLSIIDNPLDMSQKI